MSGEINPFGRSIMIRFALVSVVLSVASLPALAQSDADRRARVEQALNQLPERSDVEAIMAEMPNITGALTGLLDVANDEDNQKTLEGLIGRLEGEFSVIEAELVSGQVPDLNGMMERFLLLSTDRAFMGDALDLAFQVQDVMTDALPDSAKP
jgi:hypothetical protein